MKLGSLVVALSLLIPSAAMAGPIAVDGIWSPIAPASQDQSLQSLGLFPFWAGASWDGPDLGVGSLINAYKTTGLEYLHDSNKNYTSFRFTEDALDFTKIFGITAWTNGSLSMSNGVFTYNNGAGNIYNSWDNPGQFALFRLTGPETIHYFLGIEDIVISQLVNDRDYNDFVVSFSTPQPVPEPGTLLLLGSGAAALAARRKVAARKARQAAHA